LLNGLAYIHNKGFIHRDMKPQNILIDKDGTVKIIDFNISRKTRIQKSNIKPCYTNNVVSLFYRPPEILLGDVNYSSAIDIWSLGCIFVELFIRRNLFAGDNEINQLSQIFQLCGRITEENWSEGLKLLNKVNIRLSKCENLLRVKLKSMIKNVKVENLICDMINLNPDKRKTAEILLQNKIFTENYFREPLKIL